MKILFGDVAKRPKAAVCKTAIHGFESYRRLHSSGKRSGSGAENIHRGVVSVVARWSPKPKGRVRALTPLPEIRCDARWGAFSKWRHVQVGVCVRVLEVCFSCYFVWFCYDSFLSFNCNNMKPSSLQDALSAAHNGESEITLMLRQGREQVAGITDLAELNAVREFLGSSVCPDDLGKADRAEWDLLMGVIRTKMVELGAEASDGEVLLGEYHPDDTVVSIEIRAVRLNIVTATREGIDEATALLRGSVSSEDLTGVEEREWGLLMKAIDARVAELEQM